MKTELLIGKRVTAKQAREWVKIAKDHLRSEVILLLEQKIKNVALHRGGVSYDILVYADRFNIGAEDYRYSLADLREVLRTEFAQRGFIITEQCARITVSWREESTSEERIG